MEIKHALEIIENIMGGMLVVDKETTFMIIPSPMVWKFRFEGEAKIILKEGSILNIGIENDDFVEVLKTSRATNAVILRRVEFFKVSLVRNYKNHDYCIVAADRDEAICTVKEYAKAYGYERMTAINSCAFFEPIIKRK
jgi:hypothetical protein